MDSQKWHDASATGEECADLVVALAGYAGSVMGAYDHYHSTGRCKNARIRSSH